MSPEMPEAGANRPPDIPPFTLADGDGAQLLDDVAAHIRRYVVMSEEQLTACALWALHTHVVDAFDYSPYLQVFSPEKRCGKTTLVEVLEGICARAWKVVTPSEAVIFRKIERDGPTLLLDEYDAIFGKANEYEPLRALLNAGNKRGMVIPRCAGENLELRDFSIFGPKLLAGIGRLPDTVADRCIHVSLKRKSSEEPVENFRGRLVAPLAAGISERMAAWGLENVDNLGHNFPDVHASLNDREADGWEVLLSIADLVGREWPERARRAALDLSGVDEEESLGVLLLGDLRSVFEEERIHTADLIQKLATVEESPWSEWWWNPDTDKPTKGAPRKLAGLLKPYGVESHSVRVGDVAKKGYRREDFVDAWSRFLTPSENPSHGSHGSQLEKGPHENPHEYGDVTDVTDVTLLQKGVTDSRNGDGNGYLEGVSDEERSWLETASMDEIREHFE